MYYTLVEKAKDVLNKLGDKIIDFLLGWFNKAPTFIQSLILIGVIFLSVIGLIALIKWSVKVLVPLAIIAIAVILIWKFVL